ncbi:hypothetical protein DPMN_181060 [Dreissena polymorpha]|uniref:Uncharacterized protein n=1 Tax=Dreissena polymorpha TaxID=45954 RepID=A0A9D4I3C6_DREPO|nr:hypothetical protein DPMN_181060 [Dreissena polymorpha]
MILPQYKRLTVLCPPFEEDCIRCVRQGTDATMHMFLATSMLLNHPIKVMYPAVNSANTYIFNTLNTLIRPKFADPKQGNLILVWTSMSVPTKPPTDVEPWVAKTHFRRLKERQDKPHSFQSENRYDVLKHEVIEMHDEDTDKGSPHLLTIERTKIASSTRKRTFNTQKPKIKNGHVNNAHRHIEELSTTQKQTHKETKYVYVTATNIRDHDYAITTGVRQSGNTQLPSEPFLNEEYTPDRIGTGSISESTDQLTEDKMRTDEHPISTSETDTLTEYTSISDEPPTNTSEIDTLTEDTSISDEAPTNTSEIDTLTEDTSISDEPPTNTSEIDTLTEDTSISDEPPTNTSETDTQTEEKRISDEPPTKTLETEILTEDAINTDDTHETDEVSTFINGPLDKFLDVNDVIRIFSGPFAILGEIPTGRKAGHYFIINNGNNNERRLAGKKSQFWDDCGAWSKGTSPMFSFLYTDGNLQTIHKKEGLYCVEKKKNRKYMKQSNLNHLQTKY